MQIFHCPETKGYRACLLYRKDIYTKDIHRAPNVHIKDVIFSIIVKDNHSSADLCFSVINSIGRLNKKI